MRLFTRFPVLFLGLASFLIGNNVFGWFPHQMQQGNQRIIIPCIFIAFGVAGVFVRRYIRNQQ